MFREGPRFCAKQRKIGENDAHVRFRHAGAGLVSPRGRQGGTRQTLPGPTLGAVSGTPRALLLLADSMEKR